MTDIVRRSNKEERLELSPCPICGGDIIAYGYIAFNPGTAKCQSCKRKWSLGYVDDNWQAGEAWNREQPKVKRRDELERQLSELDSKE